MRRTHGEDGDGVVELGGLRIDSAAHRVFCGEQPVPIGPTEYRLLHFFMTHAERVYTRSQLLDHVWGGSVYVEERTVDVHIRRLRKTLEPFRLRRTGADRARRRLPFFHQRLSARHARSRRRQLQPLGRGPSDAWRASTVHGAPASAASRLRCGAHRGHRRLVARVGAVPAGPRGGHAGLRQPCGWPALGRRLASRRRLPVAHGQGIWDEVQNAVHRRQHAAAVATNAAWSALLRAFRDAAAALPDAVVALDRQRRVEWFNEAAEHLLGLATAARHRRGADRSGAACRACRLAGFGQRRSAAGPGCRRSTPSCTSACA